MKITSSLFIKSSTSIKECPKEDLPEVAFVGRSNVGKSSLINMLLSRKQLAKVSQTPGKTRLINHYLVNDSWHLVDLPGYGWAKTGKSEKAAWASMMIKYILARKQLQIVFVLIDSRLEPQKIDIEYINWLGSNSVPLAIVLTKIDKESTNTVKKNLELFQKTLLDSWSKLPPFILTSSVTRYGGVDILKYIKKTVLSKKTKRDDLPNSSI